METLLLITLGAVLAVLAAMFGRRIARSVRSGVAFASVLFGFGMVIDPPARHAVESVEADRDDSEAEKDGE